jgi:hypothetical protein
VGKGLGLTDGWVGIRVVFSIFLFRFRFLLIHLWEKEED